MRPHALFTGAMFLAAACGPPPADLASPRSATSTAEQGPGPSASPCEKASWLARSAWVRARDAGIQAAEERVRAAIAARLTHLDRLSDLARSVAADSPDRSVKSGLTPLESALASARERANAPLPKADLPGIEDRLFGSLASLGDVQRAWATFLASLSAVPRSKASFEKNDAYVASVEPLANTLSQAHAALLFARAADTAALRAEASPEAAFAATRLSQERFSEAAKATEQALSACAPPKPTAPASAVKSPAKPPFSAVGASPSWSATLDVGVALVGPIADREALWVAGPRGVVGLDRATGKQKIRANFASGTRRLDRPPWPSGRPLFPDPVRDDARVFAADEDLQLRAISKADGREAWVLALNDGFVSTPAIAASTLVVATLDGDVQGIDAESGKRLWAHPWLAPVHLPVCASSQSGLAYVADTKGVLVAVGARDGAPAWLTKVEEAEIGGRDPAPQHRLSAGPICAGDRVFVASTTGTVFALDASTGKRVWEAKTGATAAGMDLQGAATDTAPPRAPPLEGSTDLLAIIEENGKIIWLSTATGAMVSQADSPVRPGPDLRGALVRYAPTFLQSAILVGLLSPKTAVAVDRIRGKALWKLPISAGIAGPVAAWEKQIFVLDETRTITAYTAR